MAWLVATAAPAAPAAGQTWANPVDIDYRYNFEQMNEGISYRTGADPAVVRYGDAYYLFMTLADPMPSEESAQPVGRASLSGSGRVT